MQHIDYRHIGLEIINEDYKVTDTHKGNFADIYNHFAESKKDIEWDKYPFIGSIDPYDNTFFNSWQTPVLIEELQKLKTLTDDRLIKSELESTVDFLKRVESFHYAHFIGD